jgi:hypothetical protein
MIRIIDYKFQIEKIDLGFSSFAARQGMRGTHEVVGRKSFSCTIESDVYLSLGQKFDHDDGIQTFYGITPLNAAIQRQSSIDDFIFIHDCAVDNILINKSKEDVPKTPKIDIWDAWKEFCTQGESNDYSTHHLE